MEMDKATEYVIELSNVTKKFENVTALDNVSLKVEKGKVFCFLGPNGSGKTTTVRLLNGLLAPTSGTARVLGQDVRNEGEFVRSRCGVQTDTNLYEKLTAKENLEIWGQLFGLKGKVLKEKVERLLKDAGLEGKSNVLAGKLSKGMKQKLAISRAIINEPEILFLDEPTAGLDPEASGELMEYLKNYVKEKKRTVFICSHRLEELEDVCERLAIISRGRILASGSLEEIKAGIWKENRFRIKLREIRKDLIGRLRKGKMLVDAELYEEGVIVSLRKKDDISAIVEKLAKEKYGIMAVEEEKHSLKDIYFKFLGDEK